MKQHIELISNAIRPVIEGEGAFLEEVSITPAGRRSLVTVLVDSTRHLSLDEVTGISRQVSDVIENLAELGEAPFTLEVSSPGVDRPLTLERHFVKNVGRLVNITLTSGVKSQDRIVSVENDVITLENSTINLAEISSARLEIEFK